MFYEGKKTAKFL